ncbi:MAG TPA: chemotaxis protein CheW [Candidatus Nanoarchaeia archaeon]|nr:chemotaxis protein CheW [Candidatus Nanoarchaeia archaeon]
MTSVENQKISREEIQMLTFALDNVSYGVNVHQVREVKNFEGVTPVPYAPKYVKGVTNLRGEVIPVIDLRKRFGMADKKNAEDAGIMVIVQDKHPIGVMVDSVMDVLTLPKKDIESNPDSLNTDKSDAVLGVAKHDKDLIIMLDLMKIVAKGELENTDHVQIQTQQEEPK